MAENMDWNRKQSKWGLPNRSMNILLRALSNNPSNNLLWGGAHDVVLLQRYVGFGSDIEGIEEGASEIGNESLLLEGFGRLGGRTTN